MSGHNKFSKIKHKKAATDAVKSKVFSMMARMITIKSKEVGGDANHPSMRTLIEKARKVNMPKDKIDKAIKKGVEAGGEGYNEVVFEAFGPGGTAILVEGITDNNNRTSQEIKFIFTKHGLSLGAPGTSAWAFLKVGDEDGSKVWRASNPIELSKDDANKLDKLIESLEEHEDIKKVYTNVTNENI